MTNYPSWRLRHLSSDQQQALIGEADQARKPFAYRRVILAGAAFFAIAAIAVLAFFFAATNALNRVTDAWTQQRGAAIQAVLDGHLRQYLALRVKDYAVWDEAYAFIENFDPAWADRNLDWLVEEQGVSGIAVLGTNGDWVYRRGVFSAWSDTTLDEALPPLLNNLAKRPADEIMLYRRQENALYWLAGSRVVPSGDKERLSEPTGFMIFARRINAEDLAYLERATGV